MKIIEVKEFTVQALEALNGLLPQLSGSAVPMTARDLRNVIDSPSSQLLMAVEKGAFVGSLTLVLFHLPTGIRARIEDLVVDRFARGKGIGEVLITYAIELARDAGASAIDLTSSPNRRSANALYRRVGFERRQTNVYVHRPQTIRK